VSSLAVQALAAEWSPVECRLAEGVTVDLLLDLTASVKVFTCFCGESGGIGVELAGGEVFTA
jgi:hypothetical protein